MTFVNLRAKRGGSLFEGGSASAVSTASVASEASEASARKRATRVRPRSARDGMRGHIVPAIPDGVPCVRVFLCLNGVQKLEYLDEIRSGCRFYQGAQDLVVYFLI